MRKMNHAVVAIAAAAIAATAAPSVVLAHDLGDTPSSTAEAFEAGTVLVVNNYVSAVTVYAVAQSGERYKLGRLDRTDVEAFSIPQDAVDFEGAVEIKVYPVGETPGLGTSATASSGIKTRVKVSDADEAVVFWLEPELTQSFTEELAG